MKRIYPTTKLLILCLVSISLAFSACKKDSNSPSKTDLLAGSSWKIKAYSVDPGFPTYDINGDITGYTTDLLSQMEACSKDDTYKFNSDKTLKFDEGASKCSDSDPQFTAGTWSFNSDETAFAITIDSTLQNMTILELTADNLKIKYSESDGSSTYSYTITFSH